MLYVRSDSPNPALAEINITPLIDVLLTVMIIFMIAAPLVVKKIPFPLVDGTSSQEPLEPRILTVSIQDSGALLLDGQPTHRLALDRSLHEASMAGSPLQVDIRPEAHSSYDNLAQVLAIAQRNEVHSLRVMAAPME